MIRVISNLPEASCYDCDLFWQSSMSLFHKSNCCQRRLYKGRTYITIETASRSVMTYMRVVGDGQRSGAILLLRGHYCDRSPHYMHPWICPAATRSLTNTFDERCTISLQKLITMLYSHRGNDPIKTQNCSTCDKAFLNCFGRNPSWIAKATIHENCYKSQ